MVDHETEKQRWDDKIARPVRSTNGGNESWNSRTIQERGGLKPAVFPQPTCSSLVQVRK